MTNNDRHHGDTWDLASSVGTTATLVAATRAVASAQYDPLINDPYAAPLVRAVGMEFFVKMLDGELDISDFPDGSPERVLAIINGMAVRTKFFDDYFTHTLTAGSKIRQAVILASGLDSRAFRLPSPKGTVVYELDQPDVIEFKTRTLSEIGAQPTADRRTVGVDLREDWPAALQAAGLDPAAPTAWLAEGLLIYLPAEAQDRLFDDITALSAPGSAVATEYAPGIFDFNIRRSQERSEAFRRQGLDLDMSKLVYAGDRSHMMEYLDEKGWQVTGSPRSQLFADYGLPAPEMNAADALGEIVYVSATLP
ncbi:MAG TPA: class I SAM-dependent methyltransferase [Mycobacterium sp.]|nr:class I SAM-dependent methyltransferase [Mycobacterium sp.]